MLKDSSMEEWGWQPNQTEQEKSQYKYVFWEILPAELRNGWVAWRECEAKGRCHSTDNSESIEWTGLRVRLLIIFGTRRIYL